MTCCIMNKAVIKIITEGGKEIEIESSNGFALIVEVFPSTEGHAELRLDLDEKQTIDLVSFLNDPDLNHISLLKGDRK